MHPNSRFDWSDEQGMLEFLSKRAFAHIFVAAEGAPVVAHAPLIVVGRRVQFHLARRNRAADASR